MSPTTEDPDVAEHVDPVVSVTGENGQVRNSAIEDRIAAFADDDYRPVVAAVSLFCGSSTDGKDAVVDALSRAWERLAAGKSIDNLAAWVTRVAMNQLRSRHRHLAIVRRSRHHLAFEETADSTGASAARLDLARAIATLTSRQQQVLALYYGLDLPVAEVAAQLAIAEGTVKATLAQSRSILADTLGDAFRGGSDA